MLFSIIILQISCPGALAEIIEKNNRNLQNSVRSSDFMSPRGALAMLCHAPRARIHCKKYHAGDMRARRRERMSKSFQSRRHHRHRRWPCRRCRHHRRSPPSLGPLGVSCQTLGLPRATSGFLRFPGASSTRTEMPARR